MLKKNQKKRKTYKIHQLPGTRATIGLAWGIYRRNFWLIFRSGALAALIYYVLTTLIEGGESSMAGQLWLTIVLAVFVWLAGELSKDKPPAFATAFYQGSATFIKQYLVLVVWMVYLIPFLTGALLAAQITNPQFGASSLEITVIYLVWLALGVISGYWIARSLFAPFLALKSRPVRAVKQSWKLTKKLAGRISFRLLIGVLLALIPVVAVIALTFIPFLEHRYWLLAMSAALDVVIFAFSFPFLVIYINHVRPYEQSPKPRPKTKK